MRRTMWLGWVMAVLLATGAASARRPEPVPESQLQPCVELMRERLAGLAASNETQVATELAEAAPPGETRLKGLALASRQGSAGTELVVAGYTSFQVGVSGTFGPWPVSVTAVARGHAIAVVKAPLGEVEARRKKDRVVWLEPGPDRDSGDAGAYPQLADHGTRMSREATLSAVSAMNTQGGLPWLAWTNTTSRPVLRRVKVAPFNDEGVEWVPVKDPDSAMHPLFVFALDLEGNGTPYLAIAYNESPVTDRTEIWRPTKGRWKKVGEASGNLTVVRRTANPAVFELVFDGYLDTTLLIVDVSRPAKAATQCVANDGLLVNGGDGTLTWPLLLAPEGSRTVKAGASPLPTTSFLSLDAPDGELARGTRVWRLAALGDMALVAFVARDPKALAKDQRPLANRILELAWVRATELD